MNRKTVIIGCSAALGVVGIAALLAPMHDVAPLVQHVAKGAPAPPPDPRDPVLLSDASANNARDRAADPSIPRPIVNGGQTPTSLPLGTDALPPQASPYIGTWMQQSAGASSTVRISLTLRDDGRYTGIASLFPPGASADAPPSRVIRSAGVWTMQGLSVVLARIESDDAQALPIGWREVYWDSSVESGDWHYTDADGLERRLIRLSAGLGEKREHGSGSGVH